MLQSELPPSLGPAVQENPFGQLMYQKNWLMTNLLSEKQVLKISKLKKANQIKKSQF
jgi:hypothetical protein